MRKFLYISVFVFLFAGVQNLSAQKFGYINSALLLSEHPEVKVADSELESLQTQYTTRIQSKIEDLKAKYNELGQKEQAGTIPRKDLEEQVKKLQEQEGMLAEEEQKLQSDLINKREELYQPIIDKINAAIQQVAEEGGYQYIFDQSQGSLLWADEKQDLSAAVKSKLGI